MIPRDAVFENRRMRITAAAAASNTVVEPVLELAIETPTTPNMTAPIPIYTFLKLDCFFCKVHDAHKKYM